jgi:hypothetical protein
MSTQAQLWKTPQSVSRFLYVPLQRMLAPAGMSMPRSDLLLHAERSGGSPISSYLQVNVPSCFTFAVDLTPSAQKPFFKKILSRRVSPKALLYEGPMTRIRLSKLAALRDENPKKLMRLLRRAWPDIKAALERGHTLRVVHARLLEDGVEMSYDLLGCYVRRLRREDSSRKLPNPPATADKCSEAQDATESGTDRDPMANVRDLLVKNRPGFHYDGEIPDKKKLY